MVDQDGTSDDVAFVRPQITINIPGTVDNSVDLIEHYTLPRAYYVTAQAINHPNGRYVS